MDIPKFLRQGSRQDAARPHPGGRFRGAVPGFHDVENFSRQRIAVFDFAELGENAFERGLAHQVAEAIDGIVGSHLAFAQDEDFGADLLDHLEHV